MSPSRCRALATVGAALLILAVVPPAFASRARPFAISPAAAYSDVLKCMALGDVDGDGRADLIGSAYNTNSLRLLRPTGDGEFAPAQELGLLAFGIVANSLDLLDLDADGHLDLIASTDDSLHLFAGNGDGTFGPPASSSFPAGDFESDARAWADVDDDGLLDFLAPSMVGDGAVLLAHGLAGGGFAAPETLWMPAPVKHVRMADANADGRLDLFAYDRIGTAVSVRIAMVGGAWTPAISSSVPEVRAVGDQDGDGRADLWSFSYTESRVWRGLGDGTFAPGPISPGALIMAYIEPVIADQDGDGRNDLLATASLFDQGALILMRSSPDGSLVRAGNWGIGATPIPFGVADVDGDGLLDAVTGSRDVGEVQVQLGLGPERFAARAFHDSGADAHSPSAVALADLNRDGRADLLFENSFGNQLTVYRSLSGGVLEYVQDLHTPTFPEGLAVADINGDGWVDVAIAGADGPIAGQAFTLNQGDGTFSSATYLDGLTNPTASQVFMGFFDNDDGPDLLYAGAPNPRVAWYQGPGVFTPLDTFALGGTAVDRLAIGRIDRDVLDDLAFISGMDSIGVAPSDGQRGFRFLPRTFVGGLLSDIALRDLDADGRLDVVVLDATSSTVVTLRSLGTGVFAAPVRFPVGDMGSFPVAVAIGDLDADDFPDLVVSNGRAVGSLLMATATLWYNDQHGGFTDRVDFITGPHGGRLALGDVDGNGTLDLAVANGRGWLGGSMGSGVSLMLSTFPSPPASSGPPLAAPTAFALPRVWPNPLRVGGELRLDLVTPSRGEVVLELLDLQGRRLREQSFPALEPGRHSLRIASQGVPPGLYFVRASQGPQQATQRVVVL